MMTDRSTKEFQITDYVHSFEKSLNYLAGAILAIIAAAIGYLASKSQQNMALLEMFQNIYDDPKETICVFMAVLSTLPYYVYYTLKENLAWNACNVKRDHVGLFKIGIIYEICVMSFLYLLFQGNTDYACFKLVVSLVNIVLVGVYLFFLYKEYTAEQELHIGYFIVVIISTFLLFIVLCINSLYKMKANINEQKYTLIPLVLIFFFNAVINIGFLTPADKSTAETGIISNRIKIMIPIISMSIFTVTVIYCFLHFDEDWVIMTSAAVWITAYEIVISCIKCRDSKQKVVWCIVSFVVFVTTLPAVICGNGLLFCELAIDWLILIGVSIYCAAIKYWGYILKFLFISEQESKSRLMNIMAWYRNSFLGSMLFILAVLLPGKRFTLLLFTIIFCSLVSELYISAYVFKGTINNKKWAYSLGRIIEFLAIILPVAVFAFESLFYTKLQVINYSVSLPAGVEISIVVLALVLVFEYVLKSWSGKSFKIRWLFDRKALFQALTEAAENLNLLRKQVPWDKNAGNFWMILISWIVYILLAGCYLFFSPFVSKNGMHGLLIIGVIVAADWFFLTRKLLDYYIDRMKEGTQMVQFKKIFDAKWKECLNSLDEFKEIKAEQFYMGDRLRPILFFLGSSYGRHGQLENNDYNVIAKTACSLELIHKSSVIFDDYIDDDTLRKGKDTFHVQYDSKGDDSNRKVISVLILLGNAMLAKAQINFAECKKYFKCDDAATIENMKRLSEMIGDLCLGCYKEISLADYGRQSEGEIKKIIGMETVSLIAGSLSLGYSCFHKDQGNMDGKAIEELGEAFGYVFQYLNDLEPFSHRESYEKHKGKKNKVNYEDKNLAMLKMYQAVTGEEKDKFYQNSYEEIISLYKKYNIEQEVLEDVNKEIEKIKQALEKLSVGNEDWVKEFKYLFDLAISEKEWSNKIENLQETP